MWVTFLDEFNVSVCATVVTNLLLFNWPAGQFWLSNGRKLIIVKKTITHINARAHSGQLELKLTTKRKKKKKQNETNRNTDGYSNCDAAWYATFRTDSCSHGVRYGKQLNHSQHMYFIYTYNNHNSNKDKKKNVSHLVHIDGIACHSRIQLWFSSFLCVPFGSSISLHICVCFFSSPANMH